MRYALLPLVAFCAMGQTKIDLTQQVRGRLPGANMDSNTVYVSQQIDWSSRVGWLNMALGSITMPESTYASLPAAVGNSGKRFTVTDCLTSACTAGGGSTVVDVRSNGVAWVVISGGSGGGGAWGSITGTLSSQTDLQSALNAKASTTHASTHQHGGSDQVATATPAANAIPKAGADGKLDAGWLPGNGYAANISSATTWTVTGATHGLATSDLDVWVRLDGGTKWIKVDPASVDINKTSYDVNVTWAVATAGRIVIVQMGVGGGGESTSVANSGATGASVLKTGTNVTARKIKAGANCTVTENTDDIEVTCTGGGSGDVTEVQAGTGLAVTNGTGPIPSLRLAINGDTEQACSGTDKIRAISATGIVTCATDQNSGGGGTAAVWLSTTVADIDIASLTTACETERTTTVAGATVGWPAIVAPPADTIHNMTFPARVTAPNTVKWAACAIGTANPPIGTFIVYVIPPTV